MDEIWGSSQKNSVVYFEKQPINNHYPHTISIGKNDKRTDISNYRVAGLLKSWGYKLERQSLGKFLMIKISEKVASFGINIPLVC